MSEEPSGPDEMVYQRVVSSSFRKIFSRAVNVENTSGCLAAASIRVCVRTTSINPKP